MLCTLDKNQVQRVTSRTVPLTANNTYNYRYYIVSKQSKGSREQLISHDIVSLTVTLHTVFLLDPV